MQHRLAMQAMFALLDKANIAQRKKNDRQGHSSFCSFLLLIFVYLDVRAANISLGHDLRTANIG
jgi:hypothetical protein